ncbi:MAG TPA: M23 family metallopeptidase [Gemmatimonadales bacterium]|nr:M23 family metallopeptidase [Gemmatimonadales bacterium]
MSKRGPHVTIVVHRDGALDSRTYRIPRWAYRAAIAGSVGLGVLLLLSLALFVPITATAARVPALVREVERLERENRRIGDLTVALDSAERRYDRIRAMLGADIVPAPVQLQSQLVAPAIRARIEGTGRSYETGPSEPRHWPLDDPGYVTRGQAGASPTANNGGETHPGIDIAVPIGSAVRAAGGGNVLQTGEEAEYGNFVLLEHPNGYQSMYGHLSRITVSPGQPVNAGQVIGLSGNSGRSSAPHLHFEIRHDGQPIDPRTLVKEQS